MNFPALMPKALLSYETAVSEENLFDLLIQRTNDLVLFFETATADETWSESHTDFLAKLIEWLTNQSFDNLLSLEHAKRSAKCIQSHFFILERLIPLNIEVKLKDTSIQMNSLLLSTLSEFFRDILIIECRDKQNQILKFPTVTYELFAPIQAYANTGNIPDIWKKEKTEVEALLRQALSWNIESVNQACQSTLKKYINSANYLDSIIQAQQELWVYFKRDCIDFINDRSVGFRLDAPTGERLAFEFFDFRDSTLSVFNKLRFWVTDLICKKSLNEHIQFSSIIRQCPKLVLLDISGSNTFSEYLSNIPKDLQGICLAECSWLNQKTLKKMAEICPNVKELILSSNYQLNFAAWGELIKFNNIKSLNLSRCHQISDDDFITILKACSGLTDLILDDCRKIGDKGFFELVKNLPRLTTLSLSHSAISDSALLEIAARSRVLNSLNLSRCEQLTEKGFKELAKHAFVLKELNVSECHISEKTIGEMRERHPYLRIRS